jgi:hypothetical protein
MNKYISVYDANLYFSESVEKVKEYVNSINYDDQYFINDEDAKKLKSKIHYEKDYDAPIYNGFTLFNFNFDIISINEQPQPIFKITEFNDSLYIENSSNIKFLYKTTKSLKYEKLPQNIKLSKGDKMLIVHLNDSKCITKYLSITYEN